MNKEEIMHKIFSYINSNYEIKAEIIPDHFYKKVIYIATKKYDLKLAVAKVDRRHYLYGICEYYINFHFEANKKYRVKEGYFSSSWHDEYNENDLSNIDEFLNKWCCKKEFKQISIFDFIK